MTLHDLFEFLRAHTWAVEATAGEEGVRASVIGYVVSDRFELFFDMLKSSRKYQALRTTGAAALVIGWDEGRTVQLQGVADEPENIDLDALLRLYFERFPDGRKRAQSPEIAYIRIKPTWLRFSDFNVEPPLIVEWTGEELVATEPRRRQ